MRNKALLVLGILTFVILFGYLGGESTPDVRERIEMSDDNCYTDYEKGDPAPTYCLLEEEPPDIRIKNWHDKRHNVSVRIFENSTVTYSANSTLDAASGGVESRILTDVVRTPGNYTIEGTVDGQRNDSYTDTVEDIYVGDGGPKWVVLIDKNGELDVRQLSSA